jgi:hypothetical protein
MLLAALIGNTAALCAQAHSGDKSRNTVGYLCGQLLHVDSRIAGGYGSILEHTSPLPNIALKVFSRDKRPCCANLQVVQQSTTATTAGFNFN